MKLKKVNTIYSASFRRKAREFPGLLGRKGLETISSVVPALFRLESTGSIEAIYTVLNELQPQSLSVVLGEAYKIIGWPSRFGRIETVICTDLEGGFYADTSFFPKNSSKADWKINLTVAGISGEVTLGDVRAARNAVALYLNSQDIRALVERQRI